MIIPDKDVQRFHSKHTVDGESGCSIWQGPLDKDGYGTFFLMGKPRRAQRVAWLISKGPLPKGLLTGHTCRNRSCVNPTHLKLVTPRENALENSVSLAALNAQKTHCKHGHMLDKSYVSKQGRVRYCSICANAKMKRRRAAYADPLAGII